MLLRLVSNMSLCLNHHQEYFCEQLRMKLFPIRTRQPRPAAQAEVQPQIMVQQTVGICVKPTQ